MLITLRLITSTDRFCSFLPLSLPRLLLSSPAWWCPSFRRDVRTYFHPPHDLRDCLSDLCWDFVQLTGNLVFQLKCRKFPDRWGFFQEGRK